MILVLVLLLGTGVWLAYGRNGTGFLPGFAHLLDRPQIVGGFVNWLADARTSKASSAAGRS